MNSLAQLVETHIARQSGLKGLAIKAGFAALRVAKPDITQRAVKKLLPDIATALDPHYAEFKTSGKSDFGEFLGQRAAGVSASIMAVINSRIDGSSNQNVKAMYARFQSSADGELQKLLPTLGRILAPHIS